MARFARIDSQIRANRLILANRFRVPEPNPFFCEYRFGGAKNCELQVWGNLRESLERYENGGFSANRPDSRCESPGHLRWKAFFFTDFCFVSSLSPNSTPTSTTQTSFAMSKRKASVVAEFGGGGGSNLPLTQKINRHSPKGARAKGAWGNLDIGHTNFIPTSLTTYQRHGVTMTVIDSNV